jgi:hypothetical protein
VITETSKYKSRTGITVATHYSTTTFSYNGTKVLLPKSLDTDIHTFKSSNCFLGSILIVNLKRSDIFGEKLLFSSTRIKL